MKRLRFRKKLLSLMWQYGQVFSRTRGKSETVWPSFFGSCFVCLLVVVFYRLAGVTTG